MQTVMPCPGTLASEYEGHFLLYLQILLVIFSHLPAVSATRQQIRYLDNDRGHDNLECRNGATVSCKTLYHALDQQHLNNLELWVRPGEYNYTNDTELRLINPENFTLRVDPNSTGEVIFRCPSYTDSKDYNGMAIIGGSNVKIEGITVEDCGPYAAGIYVKAVHDIIITNCTFRLVENS